MFATCWSTGIVASSTFAKPDEKYNNSHLRFGVTVAVIVAVIAVLSLYAFDVGLVGGCLGS